MLCMFPPSVAPAGPRGLPAAPLLAPVDGALELSLVHLRTALDAEVLRFVVELLVRAALRAVRAGAKASAAARGHVAHRGAGALARLAGARAFLVDRAGRNLLGQILGAALLELAVLDVLVLTSPLRSLLHPTRRHLDPPRRSTSNRQELFRMPESETTDESRPQRRSMQRW